MYLYFLMAVIAAGILASVSNWRHGIYFLILVAAIQDPIRKMVPGAPGYLVLATFPIWVAMLVDAAGIMQNGTRAFWRHFPDLKRPVAWFLLALLPAAVVSATYGPGSWQVTLVGLFSYGSLLLGILLGFAFPRKERDLPRVIAFYCLVTAIMLIGTPLDHMGIFPGWQAIGTAAMGHLWLQTQVYGVVLELVAGFYRSPDVMGWHAAALVMLTILMAIRSKNIRRYLWLSLTAWGLVSLILCGRRKMLYMLPVFVFVLFWLSMKIRQQKMRARTLVLVLCLAIVAGGALYQTFGRSSGTEIYYFKNPQSPWMRIQQHGISAVITTFRQSGFFGEGLGTATQGVHNLRVARPRTWQEGGLSRIMVELGVPGFVCLLYLGITMFRTSLSYLQNMRVKAENQIIYNGLGAFLAANVGSFVVSHQIYGDPFVNVFIAFILGAMLSGARSGKAKDEAPQPLPKAAFLPRSENLGTSRP